MHPYMNIHVLYISCYLFTFIYYSISKGLYNTGWPVLLTVVVTSYCCILYGTDVFLISKYSIMLSIYIYLLFTSKKDLQCLLAFLLTFVVVFYWNLIYLVYMLPWELIIFFTRSLIEYESIMIRAENLFVTALQENVHAHELWFPHSDFVLGIKVHYIIYPSLVLFLFLLLIVAYFTLMERQLIASVQRRQGPNYVGVFGLLQPLADGIKLLTKEMILPSQANIIFFILSPIIVFVCSFLQWVQIPVSPLKGSTISAINLSLLYMGAIGSIGSTGVFLAGWSSNSKYALLGSLRSIAQIISYELLLSTLFLCIGAYTSVINFNDLVIFQEKTVYLVFPLMPLWIIFFIITLAETNRAPVDLPEGESEIVAGFNVEYSGIMFALFFLGEYAKILAVSAIHIILFFGGWYFCGTIGMFGIVFYAFKVLTMSYLFILIRTILPRYRVDQFMAYCWKILLPTLLAIMILLSLYRFYFF